MNYLIFAALLLAGCLNKPVSTTATNNPELNLNLLFEHDGCKVYRFYDGRSVYYTDCRGSAMAPVTTSTGKITTTYMDAVHSTGRAAHSASEVQK